MPINKASKALLKEIFLRRGVAPQAPLYQLLRVTARQWGVRASVPLRVPRRAQASNLR